MAMPTHGMAADSLGYAADHIRVPDGHRVEIIEGELVVSPTPQGYHAFITFRLGEALRPLTPEGVISTQVVTLDLPESHQRYIPDLVLLPEATLRSPEWLFPARAALLVAEVTSPGNGDVDRVKKLRGYAAAGIPVYVLVDRDDGTVSVFSDPEGRIYRQHSQVPFGEPAPLPVPFLGSIATDSFE